MRDHARSGSRTARLEPTQQGKWEEPIASHVHQRRRGSRRAIPVKGPAETRLVVQAIIACVVLLRNRPRSSGQTAKAGIRAWSEVPLTP